MSAPTAVLFDVPGPRARARNTVAGAVTLVVVLALLGVLVWRLAATGQLDARVWEWVLYENVQLAILDGLIKTLQAFATGAVLALALGALLALGRLSDHRPLRSVCSTVVELFRAVPLVVLMFLFYYGLPSAGITVSTFVAVVLGLMLYNGAVLAEVFRAGVLAVPRGQSEAAYALGMRKSGVMRFVLLPQAVRSMLPSIVSQLVVLLKDTALGFVIGYQELLVKGQEVAQDASFRLPYIPVAVVIGAVYIVLCSLLSWLAVYVERRTGSHRRPQRAFDTGVGEPVPGDAVLDLPVSTAPSRCGTADPASGAASSVRTMPGPESTSTVSGGRLLTRRAVLIGGAATATAGSARRAPRRGGRAAGPASARTVARAGAAGGLRPRRRPRAQHRRHLRFEGPRGSPPGGRSRTRPDRPSARRCPCSSACTARVVTTHHRSTCSASTGSSPTTWAPARSRSRSPRSTSAIPTTTGVTTDPTAVP